MISHLWVPLCSCLFPRAVAPPGCQWECVWWGEGRERWAEASRPRPGHGTSVGLGTGIDPLGSSARARIASCHNNLLLSSHLIDGAELAPCDAPRAPGLPKPLDPAFLRPRGIPSAEAPSSSWPRPHTWAWWVLGPALCLLLPCPSVSSPSHCPTLPLMFASLGP